MRTSVYVIAAENGPVKIGIAQDPFKRLKQLQTGSAPKLRIAYVHEAPNSQYARAVERLAHESSTSARLCGEWFDLPVEEAGQTVWSAASQVRSSPPIDLNAPASAEKSVLADAPHLSLESSPAPTPSSRQAIGTKLRDAALVPRYLPIRGGQIRAARAILRWSVKDLSRASSVEISAIEAAEAAEDMHGVPDGTVINIAIAVLSYAVRFTSACGVEYPYRRLWSRTTGFTPATCRAARAMIGWRQDQLSESANINRLTLAAYERGQDGARMRRINRDPVIHTFERLGLEFIPTSGGADGLEWTGLRLRSIQEI